MSSDSDTNSNSNSSVQELQTQTILQTLQSEIELLKTTTDFLLHRLDSMQRSLDQETFSLADHKLQLKPTRSAAHVRLLLAAIGVQEATLTLGTFLKALNVYLLHQNLVDLNDLQIHLNPLLKAAFQKPLGVPKVPYGLLLNTLPKLFL